MDKGLLAQLNDWHEEDEHDRIVDRIMEIPEQDRNDELVSLLARALNNLDRYDEALQLLLTIAEQGENNHLWHFRTGYSYYYLNKYKEAVKQFERADQLEPGDDHTLLLLDWSREGVEREEKKQILSKAAVPFEEIDFSSFWEDNDYSLKKYVSEPPSDELIASIEQELGYKLPASYINMMKVHNGGIPKNSSFPTTEPTSWAEDHIAITGIMGIGREKRYSLCGDLGSLFMIEEWGYPDIGVVICDCPSAGHDVVMLDYRLCGRDGEPQVVHVDQEDDYNITFLAKDYETFISELVNGDVYDTSEADKQEDLQRVAGGGFSPLLSELCDRVTEVDNIESIIRTICTTIVEEKGHFSFHADELSTLMYDVQFWLYTKTYPNTNRSEYLEAYKGIIAFGAGEFSQHGYGPSWITDWLNDRLQQGMIVEHNGALRLTDQATEQLVERLRGAGMMDEMIKPFLLVAQDNGGMSVILNVGTYKKEVFQTREDEGFEGNGYDWGSLAAVFLEEKMPQLAGIVHFDPEADMFCAYSSNREAIRSFIIAFKKACEDDACIRDLFSRAELD